MEKELRNEQYLAKLDRGFEQVYSGRGQVHELIEDEWMENTMSSHAEAITKNRID